VVLVTGYDSTLVYMLVYVLVSYFSVVYVTGTFDSVVVVYTEAFVHGVLVTKVFDPVLNDSVVTAE